MWWLVLLVLALGCPTPAIYTEVRPGLGCERATRVAYKTLEALGYTITQVVVASPERSGTVAGTKTMPDGSTRTGRVVITCDARGATVTPIEDALVPDYEFSRGFGYGFKELVKHPDVEEPWVASGLQVLVHAINPQEATLDLGGVPTTSGAVPVRVTIRNDTDRAVAFDPERLELVDAAGTSASALGGDALAGAIVAGPAGERVCGELLPSGHLVFPRAAIGRRGSRSTTWRRVRQRGS